MQIRNQFLLLLFLLITIAVLFNSLEHTTVLEIIFKPLIVVWIASYFIVNLADKNHRIVLPALIAYFFSWVGDIVLLFSGPNFFLIGLGAFLLAHLSFIFVFQHIEDKNSIPILKEKVWLIIPFVAYGILLFWLLCYKLTYPMKIAITLYATTILTMAAMALNRKNRVPLTSFLLVMSGAILFVSSDSLIAINKFYAKIPHSGLWVMSSYILAQFLIMIGLLVQVNRNRKVITKS
jgi:uncharacterized membrane protein YhhN